MNSDANMHHIQRKIIVDLARTSPLRFSKLQPPRTPNNTFSYHLKKLVNSGYVKLTDEGYVATRKALKMVFFGANTNAAPSRPDTITMIFVENSHGQILLLNRNRQPFRGWYGVPGGLIHRGETPDEAARRELTEKTTLVADKLQLAGVLDFRYTQNQTQDIFMHAVGFIYKCKLITDGHDLSGITTRYGELLWSELDHDLILPEVYYIKKITRTKFGMLSANFDEPTQVPNTDTPILPHVNDIFRAQSQN